MHGRQEPGKEASHNDVTRLLVSCIAIRRVYIRLYMYGRSALLVAKYLHMKPLTQAPTQLSVACMRDGKQERAWYLSSHEHGAIKRWQKSSEQRCLTKYTLTTLGV